MTALSQKDCDKGAVWFYAYAQNISILKFGGHRVYSPDSSSEQQNVFPVYAPVWLVGPVLSDDKSTFGFPILHWPCETVTQSLAFVYGTSNRPIFPLQTAMGGT